ncbi:hypothetical protein BDW69DRAFT_203321 [Aspergillus filifer]
MDIASPITTCLGLARMCSSSPSLLGSVEAAVHVLDPRNDHFRAIMTNLQELAFYAAHGGLVCAADQRQARPRWEEWNVAEATRRTLFVIAGGLPAPANLLLWRAGSRWDWEREYQAYIAEWYWMDDGTGSGGGDVLAIDEVWPAPVDLGIAGMERRTKRVEKWAVGLDEFGMMLYAVMQLLEKSSVSNRYSAEYRE